MQLKCTATRAWSRFYLKLITYSPRISFFPSLHNKNFKLNHNRGRFIPITSIKNHLKCLADSQVQSAVTQSTFNFHHTHSQKGSLDLAEQRDIFDLILQSFPDECHHGRILSCILFFNKINTN